MKSFRTTISIQASPDDIWKILTDAPGYPKWNNTVERIDGTIALGEKVTVRPKINPGRAFPVKVTEMEPGKRMVWSGGMPLGLFKGQRTYTLTPRSDGSVEFAMKEEFTGLLAGLIGRTIPDLQPAFDEFASDLKRTAEKAS